MLLTVVAASCGAATTQTQPPIVQPGAPGEASRVIAPANAVDLSQVGHTAADVQFMGALDTRVQTVEGITLDEQLNAWE